MCLPMAKNFDKICDQNLQNITFNSLMDTLLNALDDGKEINVVKKQLKELIKSRKSVPKPLEKVLSDRAERGITYKNNVESINKWHEIVVSNRKEKCLDLTEDKRDTPRYKNMINKFKPETDFERDIEMVIINAGVSEDSIARREVDELESKYDDLEEIKARQGELAKIKALMFYDQMKRHRINKIKSKAYHRIRKKQLLRQAYDIDKVGPIDSDIAKNLKEEEITRRVKERMDLKHKNTGKWARMASKFSRSDKNLR